MPPSWKRAGSRSVSAGAHADPDEKQAGQRQQPREQLDVVREPGGAVGKAAASDPGQRHVEGGRKRCREIGCRNPEAGGQHRADIGQLQDEGGRAR